jgi:hypothetical protein
VRSKHVYTATLLSDPEIVLQLDDDSPGDIELNAGQAPHVSGSLRLKPQSVEVLEALDPRVTPRIRLDVSAEFPTGTRTRSFDLGVRDRDRDQESALADVPLASDEALLTDFAPLDDDLTPFQHQDSLRGLVSYVLDTAIPGASLEPGDDTAIRALSDSQNLIRNPRCANNTTDWGVTWATGGVALNRYPSGGPSYAPTYAQLWANVADSTGVYVYITEESLSVSSSRDYVLGLSADPPVGVSVVVDAIIYDASGNIVGFSAPVTLAGDGTWHRLASEFTTPATGVKVRPRLNVLGTMTYGVFFGVTAARLSEDAGDPTDLEYWDGDTTDTPEYEYEFADAAHASVSHRSAVVDAPTPDAILWPAGKDALEYLQPLVQAKGLRLVCDELRQWTLRDAGYTAPGSMAIRFAVNMVAGRERISRDSGLWFDARVTRYKWRDRNGVQHERVDAFALNTPYTKLTTLDVDAPYPGPGRSEYAVHRAQGRGREVTATKVADWTEHAEQSVSVVLDGAPTQIGLTQSVRFDLSSDEVTVQTRTTDVPEGAVDLLEGAVDALVGTVNDL